MTSPTTPAAPAIAIAAAIAVLAFCTACERTSHNEDNQARKTTIGAADLHQILASQGAEPLDEPVPGREAQIALGQALFFDPILSGNLDTSCATCHNPCTMGGDERSLSVGTGFIDTDEKRLPGDDRIMVARNATELFNRGDHRWTNLFWDARLTKDESGYFVEHMPLRTSSSMVGTELRFPEGLDNLLAAQAMFPVTSRHEMRGKPGDIDVHGKPNELAPIPNMNRRAMWDLLMDRLRGIDGYRQLFAAAYPERDLESLDFTDAANALAGFQIAAFTLLDSPFDRFLEGDDEALDAPARRGAALFYGDAGCAECHSGALLTDQKPHNIGVPQIGPGREPGEPFDEGVYLRGSDDSAQRFAFRTPPLRNVAVTGPYMHNGAYPTLEQALRHHLDPLEKLATYDPSQLEPVLRDQVRNDPETQRAIGQTLSPQLPPATSLSDDDIDDLMAFLHSLTSPSVTSLNTLIPDEVPSGLPVEQCTPSSYLPQ